MRFEAEIRKAGEDEKRLVFGWSSVAKVRGAVVSDFEGDTVDVYELERAAADFATRSRHMNVNHAGPKVAELVSSLVFTPEVLKALNLEPDAVPEGWFTAWKVHDDSVWARVKSGELKMLSLEGRAGRRDAE